MNIRALNDQLIAATKILEGERILVVDSNGSLVNKIKENHSKELISFCHDGDFRSITQYPDEYMNSFDVVICPKVLYYLQTEQRMLILECLVYAMNSNSRIITSFPNIQNFEINKNFELENKKYILRENDKYFILKNKKFFFYRKDEVWNKSAIYYYQQLFKVWNQYNPVCQWDLDHIAITDYFTHFVCAIDMKKKIQTVKIEK